jgi:hypothetical protein
MLSLFNRSMACDNLLHLTQKLVGDRRESGLAHLHYEMLGAIVSEAVSRSILYCNKSISSSCLSLLQYICWRDIERVGVIESFCQPAILCELALRYVLGTDMVQVTDC